MPEASKQIVEVETIEKPTTLSQIMLLITGILLVIGQLALLGLGFSDEWPHWALIFFACTTCYTAGLTTGYWLF